MKDIILSVLKKYLHNTFNFTGEDNVLTICPFHANGAEKRPSFGINIKIGVFNCFTCHKSGTIKKLLSELHVPQDIIEFEVAEVQPFLDRQHNNYTIEKEHQFNSKDPFEAKIKLPESILGIYDWCPQALLDKGFDSTLLKSMDVGYDKIANRITYPIRDLYGNFAGIVGGVTELSKQQYQKYKVYQGSHIGKDNKYVEGDYGAWFDKKFPNYTFKNHNYLWNFNKVYKSSLNNLASIVYMVEGFKACLWMQQCGFQNTIAIMGSSISGAQELLIHRLSCELILCFDNDYAGRKATLDIGRKLYRPMHARIKVMRYADTDNSQPDDYDAASICEMINGSQPFQFHSLDKRVPNEKRF